MPVVIAPFEKAHLDAAGRLLAGRQAILRSSEPALAERYLDPAAVRPLVAATLDNPDAHGVVALAAGRMVGYLLGVPLTAPPWERTVWSGLEDQAMAPDGSSELVWELYAAWAAHWVGRGLVQHLVNVPAAQPQLLDAWFSLGFGKMQAYGVRETVTDDLDAGPQDVTIKRATRADLASMEPLRGVAARHSSGSPTFMFLLPEHGWASWHELVGELENPETRILLALQDGSGLGLAIFYDAEPGLGVPDGAWELASAVTLAKARRMGVQRALLCAGLRAARAAGAGHCTIDWRTANLLAARTWPRLGFRVTHYRLSRVIDARIVPGRGAAASV